MTGPDDVRRAMGLDAKPPALTVQCPHCRAGPGEPCHGRTPRSGQRRDPHPSRTDAAPDAVVLPFRSQPSG